MGHQATNLCRNVGFVEDFFKTKRPLKLMFQGPFGAVPRGRLELPTLGL